MPDLYRMERALRDMADLLAVDFDAALIEAFTTLPAREVFGGEGSGNFGHAGRPGEVGGSAPGTGGGGSFDNSDDGRKLSSIYHEKKYSERGYSDKQVKSFSHYQSNYEEINGKLRNQIAGVESLDDIKLIDSAMKPVGESLIVYRGFGSDISTKVKNGDIITDNGFISTSLNASVALQFTGALFKDDPNTIARISLPKETPVVFIRGNEREVLVNRGSSFRVTNITQELMGEIKTNVVNMEYVK